MILLRTCHFCAGTPEQLREVIRYASTSAQSDRRRESKEDQQGWPIEPGSSRFPQGICHKCDGELWGVPMTPSSCPKGSHVKIQVTRTVYKLYDCDSQRLSSPATVWRLLREVTHESWKTRLGHSVSGFPGG